MKVFVNPFGTYSPAMVRIANALRRHAPASVTFVDDHREADLVVLYVIGWDQVQWVRENLDLSRQHFAVVQCCLRTAGQPVLTEWAKFWKRASAVWSYYSRMTEIADQNAINFLYAPLGVDEVFFSEQLYRHERSGVVTTGHLSHPAAEAIEEVWAAALKLDMEVFHLGTKHVSGVDVSKYPNVNLFAYMSDKMMVDIMSRAQWSCALRHCEGFELPAAEGLACGLRPVLFAQTDLHRFYGPHAVYVSECDGQELVDKLTGILAAVPIPVSDREREEVRRLFDWKLVAETFWTAALSPLQQEVAL